MKKLWGLAHLAGVGLLCLPILGCGDSAEFSSTNSEPVGVTATGNADETADAQRAPDLTETTLPDDTPTSGETEATVEPVEEPPAIVDIKIPLVPYDRLLWHWECAANGDIEIFPSSPTEAVVQGPGPHAFDPEELPTSDVVLTGRICTPEERNRDLVFVIDVSGSMDNNDPMINGSCGRLRSVEAVLANLPNNGNSLIGLTTFSTATVSSTSKLFSTLDGLAADVAPDGDFASIVCAEGGGTNYSAGLLQATQLLGMGREDATKEVYFISDGQPNVDEEGIVEAQEMRNPGITVGKETIPATIATVMLGGVDSVLESQIASKDIDGNALHAFAAYADGLAATLEMLADNEIVSAELMYRPIGKRMWERIDMTQHMLNYEYQLPEITLSKKSAPAGFEIIYLYRDRHGNTTSERGKIEWRNKQRATCEAYVGSKDCLKESEK